jgi:multiple sugar transport system substrate-binding protein
MVTQVVLSRRRFLSVAGLALAGVVAAACTPAKPTETPAKPTPASTAVPQVQTLRVAHWWPDNMFTPIFARFNELHPTIQMKEEAAPWDGFHDRLLTQVAAGTAPDVTLADAGYFLQLISAGVFHDITELLKSDKEIDPTKWALDPIIDSGYMGKAFGMPFGLPDSMNLYVQKDLFDAAGIKVPEYGTPEFMTWNWDKFLEVAKALTKRKADGTAEQWGVAGPGPVVDCPQRDMVWTNGAEFFDDVTMANPKEAKFTDPAFIEAWQWLVDLELKHHVTLSSSENKAFGDQWSFMSGKVAMTWNWNGYDWYLPAKFEWTVIAPPYQKRVANKYGGNSWFIPASTKGTKVNAGWEWLKWVTTSEEGEKMMLVGGLSSYWPERMMPLAKDERQKKLWGLLITKAQRAVKDNCSRPFGFGVHAKEIEDTINAENDLIYNGTQTVTDGMTKAKAKVDKILAGA